MGTERVFYRVANEREVFCGLHVGGDTYGGVAFMRLQEFTLFMACLRHSLPADVVKRLHFLTLSSCRGEDMPLMLVGVYLRVYPATLLDIAWADHEITEESLFSRPDVVRDINARPDFVPTLNYISELWLPDPYWRSNVIALASRTKESKAKEPKAPDLPAPFRDLIADLSALDSL